MPFVWGKLSKLSFYLKFKDKVSKCTFLKSRHGKFQVQLITTFDNVMRTNLRSRVESQPIVTTRRLYSLTIPASYKSSTKDLKSQKNHEENRYTRRLFIHRFLKAQLNIRTSRVSSLEAFSYYPTSGSFAALSSRATAFTGYSPQRFLSY